MTWQRVAMKARETLIKLSRAISAPIYSGSYKGASPLVQLFPSWSCMRIVALSLSAAAAWSNLALAQEKYPAQPVTTIVPFTAGGGVDILSRALALELGKLLGQSFIVVNRDGAAGTIGFAQLAQAKPDGYTIAISPATPMTNSPHLTKNLAYSFDSFVPVCASFDNEFAVLVNQASPYRTLKELVDDAKAKPGKLSWGSVGYGSIPHLSGAALVKAASIEVNNIPYRGDAQMLPNLISGELTFGVGAMSSIAGRGLRPLVVFSEKRHPGAPDVATVLELGYPNVAPGLNGVFATRGTPEAILDTLEKTCEQAVRSETYRSQSEKLHQTPKFEGRVDFARRLRADFEAKARLVKELDLKPQ
ncbi:MAG: tripartite tricarboxylate transporter substrate binding protein [Betaproteobacteria bacterium]|nr:tripartite tricarboxylate transporter substrate binding protein [Betaproteobacteria bacterium]